MEQSDAIEAKIREKAEKLDQICDEIMGCRVVVEPSHKHRHKGNNYHVRIDLTVPEDELVVSRSPDQRQSHQDIYVAIRDAFDAARRQLEDYVRRRRGKVKAHEPQPHGWVSQLEDDHGMIETTDGRIIYFHKNSVINGDFTNMDVGIEVRYVEEQGDLGPQASSVYVVSKSSHAP
jgi:ribosome-associated translation inhibitor RaiA